MPATPGATEERPALSRDVQKFLTELAVALNNHGIYPEDHPQLRAASEAVRVRLGPLLEERPLLSIGVAHRQLVVDGCTTEPGNPVLRGLAQRLHRRRIGGLTLEAGLSNREFANLLRTIADEEVDLFDEQTAPTWDRAAVHPIDYSRLQLSDKEESLAEVRGTRASSRLWLRLASTAMGGTLVPSLADTEPAVLARAMDTGTAENDRIIAECLLQLASELRHNDEDEDREVGERISDLVVSLAPDTLERLVAMSGEAHRRRQMVLDSSHAFAADAVVEIVRAASAAEEQTISHSLLRLFSKLASHCGSANRRLSGTASASLREQVASLVEGWSLEDPNPDAYTALLDTMTRERTQSDAYLDDPAVPEPLRVVQMCLEMDDAGPRFVAALDAVEALGQLDALLGLLEPLTETHAAADLIWDRLATPQRLMALIGRGAGATWALERLLSRLGDQAVEPLLDALVMSDARAVRRITFNCLARLGAVAVPDIVARLEGKAPWFVFRNLLSLLGEIGVDPTGPIWARFLEHADLRVRRAAVKLLLGSREWRARALCAALGDADPQMQQLGLVDAQRGCPTLAISLLLGFVRNRACSTEQRVLAIRGLRSAYCPEVREALLELGGPQRGWLGRDRLPPKSPEMLAALGALIDHWQDEPAAAVLLRLLQRSRDPELRALLDTTRN